MCKTEKVMLSVKSFNMAFLLPQLRRYVHGKRKESLMNSITQNMKFRQSLMKYSEKYGVSRTNNRPMRPLNWLSPCEFLNLSVQFH